MVDKISEHFNMDEVRCHCGCGTSIINGTLIQMLEKARGIACIPFKINSWCRCVRYNNNLPNSVPDSSHLKGLAVDIACDTATRPIILKSLRKARFKRIGKSKSFLHADVDNDKAQTEWTY